MKKITPSVIKADVGSIGRHIAPSKMLQTVKSLDCFDHPFWNSVRGNAAAKSVHMRRQCFFLRS